MPVSRYQPNAGGLKPKFSRMVTCYVCGFSLDRLDAHVEHALRTDLYRHSNPLICEQRLESLALSNKLLGRRDRANSEP